VLLKIKKIPDIQNLKTNSVVISRTLTSKRTKFLAYTILYIYFIFAIATNMISAALVERK
jgi:hypothetical protein